MLMLRLLYEVEVITILCERQLPLALSSSSSGRERAVVIRIYPAATDRAYIITLVLDGCLNVPSRGIYDVIGVYIWGLHYCYCDARGGARRVFAFKY